MQARGKGCGPGILGVPIGGERHWKTATFKLNAARLLNSKNAGADFLVVADTTEFSPSRITLNK